MSTVLNFDLYWSMRSPFCYLVLDRLIHTVRHYDVLAHVRPVYPIAIRNPGYLQSLPKHYRPYHTLDSHREAEFLGIPFRRPKPDPIVMDMETNAIAPEQPYIRRITRLFMAATEAGQAVAFLDTVMRLLWDGRTDRWDEGTCLHDALLRAGLDADALLAEADTNPDQLDRLIAQNESMQTQAGHAGVPLFVFEGEPFHGQDRFDRLLWRMRRRGLRPRSTE